MKYSHYTISDVGLQHLQHKINWIVDQMTRLETRRLATSVLCLAPLQIYCMHL